MNIIDLLYPLGGGSKWQDNELRYSLRSVEQHLKNYGEIFIIGKKPEWLQNVHVIEYEDQTPFKEKNIFTKVLMACGIDRMSENFLFMNDDHFLIHNQDAVTYPYYYKCELPQSADRLLRGKYKRALSNTIIELTLRGHAVHNFDGHCPIIYNKNKIQDLLSYPWDRYDVGFVLKSLYANTHDCTPVREYDCKFNQTNLMPYQIFDGVAGKKCFSISDLVLQPDPDMLKGVMEQLYPNKSKYEK